MVVLTLYGFSTLTMAYVVAWIGHVVMACCSDGDSGGELFDNYILEQMTIFSPWTNDDFKYCVIEFEVVDIQTGAYNIMFFDGVSITEGTWVFFRNIHVSLFNQDHDQTILLDQVIKQFDGTGTITNLSVKEMPNNN